MVISHSCLMTNEVKCLCAYVFLCVWRLSWTLLPIFNRVTWLFRGVHICICTYIFACGCAHVKGLCQGSSWITLHLLFWGKWAWSSLIDYTGWSVSPWDSLISASWSWGYSQVQSCAVLTWVLGVRKRSSHLGGESFIPWAVTIVPCLTSCILIMINVISA